MWKLLSLKRRYLLHRRFARSPGILNLAKSQNRSSSEQKDGFSCDFPKLTVIVSADFPISGSSVNLEMPLEFTFDTGADMMSISVRLAQQHGLSFSRQFPGKIKTMSGEANCYYDFVTVHSTLSGKVHQWPCCFVETTENRMLLGRAGFLEDFVVSIQNGKLLVMYPVSFFSIFRVLRHSFSSFFRHDRSNEPI